MVLVAQSRSGVWFDDELHHLDGIAASFKINNQHTSIVLPEPALQKPVIVPLLGAVDDPIISEDLRPPLPCDGTI